MTLVATCKNTLAGIIDFVLPRMCCGCDRRITGRGVLVCRECLDTIEPLLEPICARCGCPDARIKSNQTCKNCPSGKTWFIRARAVATYQGVSKTMITKLKYSRRVEYAAELAAAMTDPYIKDLQQADVIIPVPLHSSRKRERGFNQSTLIARHFSATHNIPVLDNALVRTRPTPSQTSLKKRERARNVSGAFKCRQPQAVTGKHVLLLDDVYTTGSTVNECARILVEAGAASVHCLAYARASLA